MSEQQMVCPPELVAVAPAEEAAEQLAGDTREKSSSKLLTAIQWAFSFPAMLGVLLVARLVYAMNIFFVDPDVWWHIKVGQDILRSHRWPTTDPYSFTAAHTPWIAYEWLGEMVLASVAKMGGIAALCALLMVVTSAAMLGLYYLATLRAGNCKAGFIPLFLMGPLVFLSFTLRPQMFGYLFLVMLLIALEWFRKGVSWPLWTLPVLFVVWVNTHGSFIVGIAVMVAYLCCGLRSFRLGNVEASAWSAKQRMQLELALLGALAVLPITPYGTRLAVYPFDMMFNQPLNVANIIEWRPMPFDVEFGKLFRGMVVLAVVLQILFRFTWRLEELLLAMGGTVMACIHARMLLVFVPFFVAIFATMLSRWFGRYHRERDKYVVNAVLMAGAVVAMIHYYPSHQFLQRKINADFPVEAVAYLDAHNVPGPMYNTYYFGGYLVGTGRKVFIDGRGDLYERTGVMADVFTAAQIKSAPLRILDHYQIASCLLIKDEPLAVALSASPKWKRIYADGTAAIF